MYILSMKIPAMTAMLVRLKIAASLESAQVYLLAVMMEMTAPKMCVILNKAVCLQLWQRLLVMMVIPAPDQMLALRLDYVSGKVLIVNVG